jgi:hypothetical protein
LTPGASLRTMHGMFKTPSLPASAPTRLHSADALAPRPCASKILPSFAGQRSSPVRPSFHRPILSHLGGPNRGNAESKTRPMLPYLPYLPRIRMSSQLSPVRGPNRSSLFSWSMHHAAGRLGEGASSDHRPCFGPGARAHAAPAHPRRRSCQRSRFSCRDAAEVPSALNQDSSILNPQSAILNQHSSIPRSKIPVEDPGAVPGLFWAGTETPGVLPGGVLPGRSETETPVFYRGGVLPGRSETETPVFYRGGVLPLVRVQGAKSIQITSPIFTKCKWGTRQNEESGAGGPHLHVPCRGAPRCALPFSQSSIRLSQSPARDPLDDMSHFK